MDISQDSNTKLDAYQAKRDRQHQHFMATVQCAMDSYESLKDTTDAKELHRKMWNVFGDVYRASENMCRKEVMDALDIPSEEEIREDIRAGI